MNPPRQPETAPKNSPQANKVWLAIFFVIAALVYTPWVAPYGKYEPFILGLPFTIFWWMLLSLILLLSIFLFVVFAWREQDEQGGEK